MERKRYTHDEWVAWVAEVTGGASARAIGKRIGRSHTTVSRWLRDGGSAEAVIEIATGYEAPIVRALVDTGWISSEDADRAFAADSLRRVPNVVLTAEVHRRAVAFKRLYGRDTVD